MDAILIRRISSFTYLNITQFLGALNDNIYKLLIVYFLIHLQGIENSHVILAITGAIFVIPFLLFSPISGTLADRFSKRNIIIVVKTLELVIMAFGALAFALQSIVGSYVILFLMATQSALFSPSKYGIVPELVEAHKISKANGLLTSFTFLAIIIGTFLATFITQISGRNFVIGALICSAISLAGLIASFCIEYTPPAGFFDRFSTKIVYEIYNSLNLTRQVPSLLPVIFGSAFFFFLAAFMQLNMIPFAVDSLKLTDVQGGYLFLLTALGIGIGSLLSGKISGKSAELALVPLALFVIVADFFLLDFFSNRLAHVLVLVLLLGVFGGFFAIPLDSYIQIASPKKHLGKIVAATNFLSFFGVLGASAFVYFVNHVFGLRADKGFTFMGFFTFAVAVSFAFQFFDYLTRFIGMIISRLHFRTNFSGQNHIPLTGPALYLCTHTAWNDTLLLLGAQRRRLRFFIEQEQDHSSWMKRLYRLLRVVLIPAIEPLEHNTECLKEIEKTLLKGISVCIFVDTHNLNQEIEKLKNSDYFTEIFESKNYPIIPVSIDKGEKEIKSSFSSRFLKKFRVPASISFEKSL